MNKILDIIKDFFSPLTSTRDILKPKHQKELTYLEEVLSTLDITGVDKRVMKPSLAYQRWCKFGGSDFVVVGAHLNWALKEMGYGPEYYFYPYQAYVGREWLVNKCHQFIAEYEELYNGQT